MEIDYLKSFDVRVVLSRPSQEAITDMKVFDSTVESLSMKAREASPFAFTILDPEPECVCWYNVTGNKAYTSMFYTNTFLLRKGITVEVKKLFDSTIDIMKGGGIEAIECHSTLSHPKSAKWYKALGFDETNRSYQLNGHEIKIFERRI